MINQCLQELLRRFESRSALYIGELTALNNSSVTYAYNTIRERCTGTSNDSICILWEVRSALWETMHSVHWKDVPLVMRELFGISTVLFICRMLLLQSEAVDYRALLKALDIAMLMSSPDMFTTVNALIEHLQSKVERKAFIYKAPSRIAYARITQSQQRMHRLCAGNLIDHGTGYSLCSVIESRASPDILSFYSQYFVREQPVVLTGCMEDWPAMLPRNDDATSHRAHTKGRWADLDYLLSVLGSRTVPVETGRSYLSEDSGSSFLTGEEFIRKYIVGESAQPSPSLPEQKSGRDCTESGKHSSHISQAGDVEGGNEIAEEEETELPMGYLAQHQLLEQVPALQRDVVVPDYCALLLEIDEEASTRRGGGASSAATSAAPAEDAGGGADPSEVIMQAWLGPVGTVSPLHHDPYYNLLAQTAGYKYIRLYDRAESPKLHPMEGRMTNNSQIDLLESEAELHRKFPEVASVPYQEYVLGPRDMLFIPRWWWHFVLAIDEASALRWRSAHGIKARAVASAGAHSVNNVPGTSPGGREAELTVSRDNLGDGLTCVGKKRGADGVAIARPGAVTASNSDGDADETSADVQYSFSVSFWWGARILA